MVKNLDEQTFNLESQITNIKNSFESEDPAVVAESIVNTLHAQQNHFQNLMNETIREAQLAKNENWDSSVLASRGVRQLTSAEKKFYNQAIEVQSFDGVSALVPPTVFDRVFEDLVKEHVLLSKINFQRTGATTQWVVRNEGATTAFWGDVCAEIQEMVDHGFKTVEQGIYKLSGFLVVCKAMFELGPEWLDRYVRAFLTEIIADELEKVIVDGTGKSQPIGMLRDLNGAVVQGVYPQKTATALNDLTPQTIGEKILAPTTKNGTRTYTGVTLIINPFDFASKLFAYGAKQTDSGVWTFNNFAIPGLEIIQSPAVPLNKLIVGKPADYFMGVAGDAKLESSDHVRLIEDQRLYLVRQLANGRPLDADSFTVYDITNLAVTAAPPVNNDNDDDNEDDGPEVG